jgi:GxxExxY protein
LALGCSKSTYTACLQFELGRAGIHSATQVGLRVVYCGVKLQLGYRIDLLVENLVVVEIKSVEGIAPVHQAQILSYLKLSGRSIGLLMNFNVVHLKDGIKRFVNAPAGRKRYDAEEQSPQGTSFDCAQDRVQHAKEKLRWNFNFVRAHRSGDDISLLNRYALLLGSALSLRRLAGLIGVRWNVRRGNVRQRLLGGALCGSPA